LIGPLVERGEFDAVSEAKEYPTLEPHMGEVIRFVPKSELERARLVREARAVYDSIFPSADAISEQRDDKTPLM
jgi:hypothetical protein